MMDPNQRSAVLQRRMPRKPMLFHVKNFRTGRIRPTQIQYTRPAGLFSTSLNFFSASFAWLLKKLQNTFGIFRTVRVPYQDCGPTVIFFTCLLCLTAKVMCYIILKVCRKFFLCVLNLRYRHTSSASCIIRRYEFNAATDCLFENGSCKHEYGL